MPAAAFSGYAAACCTTAAPSCRGASSCLISPQPPCPVPMSSRPIISIPSSSSPTRCRRRRCAALADRKRCSRWSVCSTAWRASCSSIVPRCAAAISSSPSKCPMRSACCFATASRSSTTAAIIPRARKPRSSSPAMTVSASGSAPRSTRAASSVSVLPITSKARGSARSKASPFACCRAARSRWRPARPIRARARAPRCRRSSPKRSAAASRTS